MLGITRFTVRQRESVVIPSSGYSGVRPDYSGFPLFPGRLLTVLEADRY